jgi:hypothetical protein
MAGKEECKSREREREREKGEGWQTAVRRRGM